jgi:CRP/FNR family cyclic AMP-dependent transcriptional regulator
MSAIELLKGCPLFYELYDAEIEMIVENANVAKFSRDDFIVREGDQGDEFYIVLSGTAKAVKILGNESITVATLEKGDVFGELVLINDTTRSADIVTGSDCEVLVLKYDDIFSIYQKKPKIFAILLLNLSRLLSSRLKSMTKIVDDLQLKTMKEIA